MSASPAVHKPKQLFQSCKHGDQSGKWPTMFKYPPNPRLADNELAGTAGAGKVNASIAALVSRDVNLPTPIARRDGAREKSRLAIILLQAFSVAGTPFPEAT
jgi:hypothetical protein